MLLVLSSVFVILFRNNGKYVVYPMLIVIFMVMRRSGILQSKKNAVKTISCLVLIILIPLVISHILTETYNIEKGSIKEMLSLPFQQTARYVIKHGDEITDEERQAIDKILDYDCLAEYYNPMLSDRVKNTFNQDSTYEEMKDYFKVWLRQFVKYPMTYITASVNQNYRLLYPARISYVYLDTYAEKTEFTKLLGVEEVNSIKMKEDNLKSFYTIMFNFPVVGALSMVAVYNLVLFYILVCAVYKRLYLIWIAAVPLIISNLVIIAGPLVHPRYAFPIIYCIPIVTALFLHSMHRQKLQDENDSDRINVGK